MKLGMTEAEVYCTLSTVSNIREEVNIVVETQPFHAPSENFSAQLNSDLVDAVPAVVLPLCHQHSPEEQDKMVMRGLWYLKSLRLFPVDISNSIDGRLQSAAQSCAILCHRNCFQLPTGLNDRTLPDLFMKLTIMEFGHAIGVDVKNAN